jgi:small subunit ribosomal protein S17
MKPVIGRVVSTSMMKTIAVMVTRRFRHPILDKYVRSNKKYLAHDEKSMCELGDLVEIVQTRPLSKRKRHVVSDIVRKAPK